MTLRGGYFLRKKLLSIVVSVCCNSANAIARRMAFGAAAIKAEVVLCGNRSRRRNCPILVRKGAV
jgi:hypothetical protein